MEKEERKKRKGKKGHRCEKKREREYQKGKETEGNMYEQQEEVEWYCERKRKKEKW